MLLDLRYFNYLDNNGVKFAHENIPLRRPTGPLEYERMMHLGAIINKATRPWKFFVPVGAATRPFVHWLPGVPMGYA